MVSCVTTTFIFSALCYSPISLSNQRWIPIATLWHCPQYIIPFFVFKLQATCLWSTTRVSAFTLKFSGGIHKVEQKKNKTNSFSLTSVGSSVLNNNCTIAQIFIFLSGLSIFSLYLSFLLYGEIHSIPMLAYISR